MLIYPLACDYNKRKQNRGGKNMENATKALLIAAGVLVVILLIALGMRIFNTTSYVSGASESQMQSTAVQTFNSQFVGYLDRELNQSQASALFQKVNASNATDKEHHVNFTGNTGTSTAPAGTYSAHYGANGYIDSITKVK